MQVDPASLGRIGVQENPAGRAQVYNVLAGKLSSLTQGKESILIAQTQQALQQVNASLQQARNHLTAASYTVWATSFTQRSLPNGLKPKTSPYVALPDAYLKYANWGNISKIPSIYQRYYAPNGTKMTWSVTLSSTDGTKTIANVLVTDVGPWNEDDNWWDANGTSATLPSSCPVSPTLIAPDATSNPLVNGICPNGQNLRRIYYYLLYTHDGLPFFRPSGYSPSGNFTDGNWPTALPQDEPIQYRYQPSRRQSTWLDLSIKWRNSSQCECIAVKYFFRTNPDRLHSLLHSSVSLCDVKP